MNAFSLPEYLPSQLERSRQAADRYALAPDGLSRHRVRRDQPAPVRRLRRAAANGLRLTARAVDAN